MFQKNLYSNLTIINHGSVDDYLVLQCAADVNAGIFKRVGNVVFLKKKRFSGVLLAVVGAIVCYLVYAIWVI